jgi:ABC-type transport system substrate-binding protein
LLLVANPHWVGPRGNIREVHGTTSDDETAIAAWRSGRHDVLTTVKPVAADEPDTLQETYSNLSLIFLGFRADRPPFDNVLVRRAVAHALDRERIAKALSTIALPATRGGAIPPAMPGHSHRIGLGYDPELARKLLAEAGYPEGKGLPELTVPIHRGAPAEPFVELLGEVGIRVASIVAEGPVAPGHIHESHAWVTGWTADYPDPEGLFQGFFAEDWRHYHDEQIDDLLARARESQVQAERMRLLHELDRLWVGEHAAIVPLLYSRQIQLRRPSLEGVWPNVLWGTTLDTAVVSR